MSFITNFSAYFNLLKQVRLKNIYMYEPLTCINIIKSMKNENEKIGTSMYEIVIKCG